MRTYFAYFHVCKRLLTKISRYLIKLKKIIVVILKKINENSKKKNYTKRRCPIESLLK